jgi:regulatory protein
MQSIKLTLLKKLQHYCAYQDRCHFEVEQKLTQLGADKETAAEIFTELLEDGFLNEERFARSVARGKFKIHHWGKNKIIAHLKARFISDPIIQMALTEIEEDAYHQQVNILLKKIFQEKKDVNRTIQAMIVRGFESELVYEMASGLPKT